jgi:hypothetical protein
MKTLSILELNQVVKDKPTGLKGTITMMQVMQDMRTFYLVQPKGLNPETQQPAKGIWVIPDRLMDSNPAKVDHDFPVEILGTEVEDVPTGFKGTAVILLLHVSGCIHVSVQPKGTNPKDGSPIGDYDFDYRRLAGDAIKKMTKEERKKSQEKEPSPGHDSHFTPRLR